MSILRIYVAAVCFIAMVFAMFGAPRFLRARQRAENASFYEKNAHEVLQKASKKADAEVAKGEFNGPGSDEDKYWQDEWSKAIDENQKASDSYEVQRFYGLLLAGIFLAHLLLLGVAEYRSRAAIRVQAGPIA